MKIIVREIEGHGVCDVFVGAEKLCRSRIPLLAAARKLILQGAPEAYPLAMWREGATVPAIITTVGMAANLSVSDPALGPPTFRPFKSFPDATGQRDEASE